MSPIRIEDVGRNGAVFLEDGTKMYQWYGVLMTEAEFDAKFQSTRQGGNRPWSKKIESDALAVHSSQIPEVMERNRKHGLHINYTAEGLPVLEDNGQRNKLMEIEGAFDRDACYGQRSARESQRRSGRFKK